MKIAERLLISNSINSAQSANGRDFTLRYSPVIYIARIETSMMINTR